MCKDHDEEKKKFYYETCENPICSDCIVLDHRQHKFISLKEPSKNQLENLRDLGNKCEMSMKKYTHAIKESEKVEKNLATASQKIKKKLHQVKSEYLRQVETIFKQHEDYATSTIVQRAKKLGDIKEDLQTELAKVEDAYEVVSKVTETGSDYDIISIYPTLSANLEKVTMTTVPKAVDKTLSKTGVTTTGKVEIPDVVSITKGETWKQLGQFRTDPNLFNPLAIAINQGEDVAVAVAARPINGKTI